MSPDPRNATIGLSPYVTKNPVHLVLRWTSVIHMIVAMLTEARPPVKST